MDNSSWVCADVKSHLTDNPPDDSAPADELLDYISKKVVERYDYTSVYDKIDSLATEIFRELKAQGKIRYEVVVMDDEGNWKTVHTYMRYCDADRRVDVYTDIYQHAICDIREVLADQEEGDA